jgi:CubicO group peptidase (beta-lactamase class C family)
MDPHATDSSSSDSWSQVRSAGMLGFFWRRSPSATRRRVRPISSFLVIGGYGHTVTVIPSPSSEGEQPSANLLRSDSASLDDVFARLAEQVRAGALPAAALAIGDADGMIRAQTFSSESKPIDPNSSFFLASVTKPIVSTAFMQLVEEGKVGLHQPIADFEPRMRELGGGREKVTPWHVMTHTSGLADFDPRDVARKRPSGAQMTSHVIESPLRFEPGTKWEYVSASFYLLTLIMERVSGLSYRDYLDTRLQHPLGMNTTFDPRRAGRPIVAVRDIGVDSFLTKFLVLRYMARAALPGGGLFGTLDDMTRFGAALLRPRFVDGRTLPLRPETIAQMGEDQTHGEVHGKHDEDEVPVHHGLGWGKPTLMRNVPGSKNVFSHGGASGTRLWVDPDAGLVFVFFTNRWAADRDVETEALRGTYQAMQPGTAGTTG